MTEIESIELVCKMAAEGTGDRAAFAALTKGADGAKGIKFEDFNRKYTQLKASPLLRKLECRQVREGVFKNALAEAVMLIDPPEDKAAEIASLLAQSRENPRRLPALFTLIAEYGDYAELLATATGFYPLVFAEPAKNEAPEGA